MLLDKYKDDTSKFDQTVSINGEVVSTLSTSKCFRLQSWSSTDESVGSGQAQGWGTAVECQAEACDGTAAAHGESIYIQIVQRMLIGLEYLDTTIILNAADSSFGDTLAINEATSSGLKTNDNGKTWTVSSIKVQSHTYDL